MQEEQYITLLSGRLRNFKKIGPSKYRCSCPVCGDSRKVRSKARGNFFLYKGNFVYHCYNCGTSYKFGTFLKHHFPEMYDDYLYDSFGYSNKKKQPKFEMNHTKPVFKTDSVLDHLKHLNAQMSHDAVFYLLKRGLKDYVDIFYYTDNFKKYVNEYLIKDKFASDTKPDQRVVIPFFDAKKKLIGMQGRSIDLENKIKYITIKLIPEDEQLIFGLDVIKQSKSVYVFEGPIDSLFVDNSVAFAGSSLSSITDIKNPVLVWDNDYQKNKEVAQQVQTGINAGFKIVLWPDRNKFKDVNEMILNGISLDTKYLEKNTYQGLQAQLEFNRQRK